MAQPNWNPKLKDVLGHDTKEITMISPRTGNEYKAEVITELKVFSSGSVEETEGGKYRDPIVNTTKNLEYTIKTENKLDVRLSMVLMFKNVRGGWYSADNVQVVPRNS